MTIDTNLIENIIKNDTDDNITQFNTNDNINLKNTLQINDTVALNEYDNNIFLKELLVKQVKNISSSKKLNYNDIKRISKFLKTSIFDKDNCALWKGYITNEKNQSKGTYINFYFNKKKIALHRLLYINYIGDVSPNEYIKFSCINKGKCCNINHMKKYIYCNNDILKNKLANNINDDTNINTEFNDSIHINLKKNDLIIEF